MKDTLIDMMVVMMPFMKPFMWVSVLFVALGFLLIIVNMIFKRNTLTGVVWSSRIVFVSALFFILAQIAGYFLNMPPTINFGDASKFEFILVSFWQISLVLFVAGLIIKLASSLKQMKASVS